MFLKIEAATCLTREDVVETEQDCLSRAFRCQNAEILSWFRKSSLLRIAPVDVIKLALLTLSIGARDV